MRVMTDPEFLAAVRGQRYAILLPRGDLAAACAEAQRALRAALGSADVVWPSPHLTLGSFAAGTELREVEAAVARWAVATPPLRVEAERIEVFEPPHRVVYLAVRKSSALERAYSRLRREASARELRPIEAGAGSHSARAWIPHLSLAYCDRLSDERWARAVEIVARLEVRGASALVPTVTLLSYDEDGEHQIATYPLLAGRRGR